MACRGCVNVQCNCFTTSSETTDAVGNGSQYAPFTFRPNNIPTPRPFGTLYGLTDRTLDAAPYTSFEAINPDLNQGGNMKAGNGTNLIATADGLYLIGMVCPSVGQAADIIDTFTLRRNGIQVSSITFVHNATVFAGQIILESTTTLLDLNTGDTLDLFVERLTPAGNITIDVIPTPTGVVPRLWAFWMGGPI